MASVAERFVNTVRELSGSAGNPVNLNALCNSVAKSFESLVKCPVAHLDNAMETLVPEQHSLGILAIILAKYQQLESTEGNKKYTISDPAELDRLLAQTDTFIRTCNVDHTRCALDTFNDMIFHMTELLIERNEARRGIQIVATAVTNIQAFETQLTVVHTNLCHLCLSARNFAAALPFLDIDITDLQKVSGQTTFDAKTLLLYYYYGGMIYTAVKNYKRALFFFEIAICTPASAVSAIMVESYKKFILISLIVNRADPSLPKFVSAVVPRYIKPLTVPYHDLALSYNTSMQATLQATVDKHKTVYEQDNNYGLVKLCLKSLYKKNIQKLTKTFLTLSLTDVANRVHLQSSEDAERYLLNMIEDGEIYAAISKKDGMVEFHDNPERYNNPKMLDFLQKQETISMSVNTKLEELERTISTTPDYVSKMSAYSADDDSSKASTSSALPSTSFK